MCTMCKGVNVMQRKRDKRIYGWIILLSVKLYKNSSENMQNKLRLKILLQNDKL